MFQEIMERRDCLINAASPPPVYSDIHSVEPGMKPPPYTDVEEHPPCYSSPELTSPIVSTEPIQPQAITVRQCYTLPIFNAGWLI